MDLEDLTPAGGSLRGASRPASAEPVARFTATPIVHPDSIWSPRGSEIAPPQRPLPGRSIEHAPVNRAEQAAQHTAQDASDVPAAASIRAALRPEVV